MKFRRLIFANLFRKKIRLVLTIGSFAIALDGFNWDGKRVVLSIEDDAGLGIHAFDQ
jgi:hypothetical protein